MASIVDDLLAKGKQAATSGQKDMARDFLTRALKQDPGNEDAWLWLSGVANTLPMMRGCLERVLAINPNNEQAKQGMAWVQARETQMRAMQAAAAGGTATAPARPIGETFTAEEEGDQPEEALAPAPVPGQEPMYPSAGMYTLLHAVEKVTGEKGVNAILRNAGMGAYVGNFPPNEFIFNIPYHDYSAFCRSLEEFYGRAAKAMQLRVGQEMFDYGLNEQPRLLGVAATAMKFMPMQMKMKFVLEKMTRTIRENVGVDCLLRDDGDHYTFQVNVCPYCYGRRTEIGCNAMVGTFTSSLRWAAGKTFPVEEVSCRGKGDETCSFRIGKTSVD